MSRSDSIEDAVTQYDYRNAPNARRSHTVPAPTVSQRLMWARGQTGTVAVNVTERGAKAARPVKYSW